MPFFDYDDYFPQDQPVQTMPNVQVLRISFGPDDSQFRLNEKLLKMTPNVTTLLIMGYQLHESDVSRMLKSIFENLRKLENFGWQICTQSHERLTRELDAGITGLSESVCQKLAAKFRYKNHLSKPMVDAYKLYERSASILDLKGNGETDKNIKIKRKIIRFLFVELKTFDVTLVNDIIYEYNSDWDAVNPAELYDVKCGDFADRLDCNGFGSESIFYRSGFTKVSKFIAFDQMPNLKIRIHKRIK